jgi:hypothetical protein
MSIKLVSLFYLAGDGAITTLAIIMLLNEVFLSCNANHIQMHTAEQWQGM